MTIKKYARCVVPTPLYSRYDYAINSENDSVSVGCRVEVPFGKRAVIAVVESIVEEPACDEAYIKPITRTLDSEPLVSPSLLALAQRAIAYYKSPPGEIASLLFPAALRKLPGNVVRPTIDQWQITEKGKTALPTLKRAVKQQAILGQLAEQTEPVTAEFLDTRSPNWRQAIKSLEEKHFVLRSTESKLPSISHTSAGTVELTTEQRSAVDAILENQNKFGCFLLDGVTGSGKTEVYLAAAEEVLANGKNILILVPEIGLTPQLTRRFQDSFNVPLVALHSGLTDNERLHHWLAAHDGHANIVIGTRSAVFTPLPNIGLIVVDEEHDLSFKQQSGLRYSARDLAIWRASIEDIPIVLGSATPSFESYLNAANEKYHWLKLTERPGVRQSPEIKLIDMRREKSEHGISGTLYQAIKENLERGEQSLLFINRRGFAPTLICSSCGWVQQCAHCDSRLTLHKKLGKLRCHHCNWEITPPNQCPQCDYQDLKVLGQGTERVEEGVEQMFPEARCGRFDRDTITSGKKLAALLEKARQQKIDILLGTQMLAKGHDFPNVTLCAVLDSDQGLFGTDFRASERLAQLLIQVAGRAGRGDKLGTVYIQSSFPSHPTLQLIKQMDYGRFATDELNIRQTINLPPFSHFALFTAESKQLGRVRTLLHQIKKSASPQAIQDVQLLGPVPAMMERRAGYHRMQLLLQAKSRSAIQRASDELLSKSLQAKATGVQFFVDIDPYDMM